MAGICAREFLSLVVEYKKNVHCESYTLILQIGIEFQGNEVLHQQNVVYVMECE